MLLVSDVINPQDQEISIKNIKEIDKYTPSLLQKMHITRSKGDLGIGTFGKIISGKLKDGYSVAIKLMASSDPSIQKKFEYEFNASSNLKHDNIIKTYTLGKIQKNSLMIYGFSMDKATLGNLQIFFDEYTKNYFHVNNYKEQFSYIYHTSENACLFFIYQILKGIEYLNRNNLVHFDMKMNNILLCSRYKVKLCDFSLLDDCDLRNDNDYFNLIESTFCYMGPEYYTEDKKIIKKYGNRMDIFSIGVMIYFIFFKKYFIKNSSFGKINYDSLVDTIKQVHEEIKKCNYISEECKKFMINLLDENYQKRMDIYNALNHVWINNNNNKIEYVCNNYIYGGDNNKFLLELQKSNLTYKFNKKYKNNKNNKNKRMFIQKIIK